MIAAVRQILRGVGSEGLPAGSRLAYAFAVLCAGGAALAHIIVLQIVDGVMPSILYNPAIFIATLIGGAGAGCLSVFLGLASLWLTAQAHLVDDSMLNSAMGWSLYLFTAGVLIFVAQGYRSFAGIDRPAHEQLGSAAKQTPFSAVRTLGLRALDWIASHSVASYLFAVACILTASCIRFGFMIVDGTTMPLVSYYPAVLLAGWAGGTGPGLLAMLVSLFVIAAEMPGPIATLQPPAREEAISIALYVFACMLSIWLAEKHRHGTSLPHDRESVVLRLVSSVLVAIAAILLTTLVLLAIDSYLDADHLVLGYLLPTIVIAMHYGSTLAVLASFASSAAAAYFLFPPKISFFISEPTHVAELGFFLVLAVIASKAVAALTDDMRQPNRGSREHAS